MNRFHFLLFLINFLYLTKAQKLNHQSINSTIDNQFSITSNSINYPNIHHIIPKCFSDCITKSTVSPAIGCKGIEDYQCFCSKQNFINITSFCVNQTGGKSCKNLSKDKQSLILNENYLINFCNYVNKFYYNQNSNSSSSLTTTTPFIPPINETNSKYPSRKGSGHSGALSSKQIVQYSNGIILLSLWITILSLLLVS